MIPLVTDILALVLLLLPPGVLLARLALPAAAADRFAGAVLVAGLSVPAVLTFVFALSFQVHLAWWMLLASSWLVASVALVVLWRLGRLRNWKLPALGRDAKLALALAAATFAIYLVNYDRSHFKYACVNSVVMYAIQPTAYYDESPLGEGSTERCEEAPARSSMDLVHRKAGQRYGTTALVAPWITVFGFFGFRFLYALIAAIGGLHAFMLGRTLGSGKWWSGAVGWGVAVMHPMVLKIVLLDENFMAFNLSLAALYYLLRSPRPAALLAGIAAGAAIGIRHIDILLLVAGLMLLSHSRNRVKDMVLFAGAAVIMLLPCAIHHTVAYGQPFAHEHFQEETGWSTPFPYSLMGLEFEYAGYLNWPVHDQLVRTPYNPLPTMLYHPVNLVDHQGLLVTALALLGLVGLIRFRRRLLYALLVWLAPPALMLLFMEGWLDPVKMGIPVTMFAGVVVAVVEGCRRLKKEWWVVLVIAAVLFPIVWLAGRVHVPADERYYQVFESMRPETPAYLDWARSTTARPYPWPNWGRLLDVGPLRPLEKLVELGTDFVHRDFPMCRDDVESSTGLAEPVGDPLYLSLSFAQPLITSTDFLQVAPTGREDGAVIDLTSPGSSFVIEGIFVPWEDKPMGLLGVRLPGGRIMLYLKFGQEMFADLQPTQHFTVRPLRRSGMQSLEPPSQPRVVLRIYPSDTVRLTETVSMRGDFLFLIWDASLDGETVELSSPRRHFHN